MSPRLQKIKGELGGEWDEEKKALIVIYDRMWYYIREIQNNLLEAQYAGVYAFRAKTPEDVIDFIVRG